MLLTQLRINTMLCSSVQISATLLLITFFLLALADVFWHVPSTPLYQSLIGWGLMFLQTTDTFTLVCVMCALLMFLKYISIQVTCQVQIACLWPVYHIRRWGGGDYGAVTGQWPLFKTSTSVSVKSLIIIDKWLLHFNIIQNIYF